MFINQTHIDISLKIKELNQQKSNHHKTLILKHLKKIVEKNWLNF